MTARAIPETAMTTSEPGDVARLQRKEKPANIAAWMNLSPWANLKNEGADSLTIRCRGGVQQRTTIKRVQPIASQVDVAFIETPRPDGTPQ